MHRTFALLCLLITLPSTSSIADDTFWQTRSTETKASLRALSIARHSDTGEPVAWAAGSAGAIVVSSDLGKSWQRVGPADYPALEFRSLVAWNERQAIIASAGTPAIVLKTDDGGQRWREVHRDAHAKAFFDGMKFLDDQRGVLFGDPTDGHFNILTTRDAGQSWQATSASDLPAPQPGEAAFAASNSSMIVVPPETIFIGTGGAPSSVSRLLVSHTFGRSWSVRECPLPSDESSGIFSLAVAPHSMQLIAVGGNYKPDAQSLATCAISTDFGQSFALATQPPSAFRSSVVWSSGNAHVKPGYYSSGPTGTDYSRDGQTWTQVSQVGYHVLAVLPDGGLMAVGSEGRVGVVE